jgi:tetratricopeptide (TPR) repeat protein
MSPVSIKSDIKLIYKQAEKFRDQGVYFQAIELYKELLSLYDAKKDQEHYGRALFQIGLCYRMANQNTKALEELAKAVDFYKVNNNHDRVAYTYREIGTVYLNLEDFSKAKEWFEKSVEILKKSNDYASHGMSLTRLGLVEMHANEFKKSEKLMLDGLKLIKKDGHWFFEVSALYFIGKLYYFKKDYQKSINQLEHAEQILDSHRQAEIHWRRYSQIWGILANNHLKLNNIELAKEYYLKALKELFDMPNNVAKLIYKTIEASEFIEELKKLE